MPVRNSLRLVFRVLFPPKHPAGVRAEPSGAFPGDLLKFTAALLAERRGSSVRRMSPAPALDGIDRQPRFCCDRSVSFPALLQAGYDFNLLVCHGLSSSPRGLPLSTFWSESIGLNENGHKKRRPIRKSRTSLRRQFLYVPPSAVIVSGPAFPSTSSPAAF